MALTPKMESFCQEYLVDLNGTQSAIRAGYSEDTAYSIAWENLRKPEIQERISELRKDAAKKLDLTKERILQEYSRLAFSDIRKLYTEDGVLKKINDLGEDEAASIAGIEVEELFEGFGQEREKIGYTTKIKRADKRAALDSLCRVLGYNAPEKVANTDKDGNDILPFTSNQVQEIIQTIRETKTA